jgi:hypothetical protein
LTYLARLRLPKLPERGGSSSTTATGGTATAFSAASSIATGDTKSVLFKHGFTSPSISATLTLSGNVSVTTGKPIGFGVATNGTVNIPADATYTANGTTNV